MTADDRLAELMLTWEDAKERGEKVSPEDLCRDSPEMLDAVKERIRLLENAGWLKSSSPKLEKRLLAGRYRLDVLLGEGGYGQVWRAFDEELQRPVALKVPKPTRKIEASQIDQLLDEARRVARLRHPGIVTVHDVVKEGAGYFIVSDLIDGSTLAERLGRGKLSVEESVKLVAQVARIIDYAHREGVVHRDLKPANVFLDAAGHPHVGDFGIARSQEELLDGSDRCGTLAYAAPEQLEGKRLDGRADIWSLGVILYEMLAGHPPFRDENPVRLKEKIDNETPPPLIGVPKAIAEVCLRCLNKQPDQRFAGGLELADALERALQASSPRRGRRWLAVGVVCILLLIVGGILSQPWLSPPPESETKTAPKTQKDPAPVEPDVVVRDDAFCILRGHKGVVRCVAVTADGNLIASGGEDGTLRLWPFKEDAPTVLEHDGSVTSLTFGPEGRSIVVGTSKGAILCWALPARTRSEKAIAFAGTVGCPAAGVWSALTAFVPHPETPWLLRTFPAQAGPVQAVAVSYDGKFVAWAGKKSIEVWEMTGTQPLTVARTPGENVLYMSFQKDGLLVAGFGYGPDRKVATRSWQMVSVNDRITASPRGQGKNLELFSDVRSITMSPGRDVVLVTQSSAVRAFVQDRKGPNLVLAGSYESPQVTLLMTALLPGGRALSVGQDRVLRLWATANQAELASYQGHTQPITALAVSEDGGTTATASEDSAVRLWRTPSFDREVAARILSLGGEVTVEEQGGDKRTKVRKPMKLPLGNFRLTEVDVCKIDQIADEDVDKVEALTALRSLKLPQIDRDFLLAHTYAGLSNDGSKIGFRITALDGPAFTGDHLVFGADSAIKHHAKIKGTIVNGQIAYAYRKEDIVKDGGFLPIRVSGTITRTRLKVNWQLLNGNASGDLIMTPITSK